MPRVPTYNRQVQQQGITGARYQENAPIEAFGGGAAVQGLSKAVGEVTGVIGDIYKEEKQKADQIAVLEADRKTVERQTAIEKQIKEKYRGKEALNAHAFASEEWKKEIPEIEQGLSSPDQRAAYQKSKADRWSSMNRFIMGHATVEWDKYQVAEMGAFNGNETASAIEHHIDRKEVAGSVDKINKTYSSFLVARGIPGGSQQHKDMINDALSPLHLGVIDKDIEAGRYEQAKEWFTTAKKSGQLKGPQLERATDMMETARVVVEGNKIFQKIKTNPDFLLPGGGVNEAAALAEADKITDQSPTRQKQTKDYVSARINDYVITENKRQHDLDNYTWNEAIKYKEGNKDLGEALQIANRLGGDKKTILQRQNQIRKIFKGDQTTDPARYSDLRDAIYEGTAGKADIEAGDRAGWLGPNEYKALRNLDYQQRTSECRADIKRSWQSINADLKKQIPNRDDRDIVKSMLSKQFVGKDSEQMLNIYQEKMKSTGGLFGTSLGSKKNWKIEIDQKRATDKVWGSLYGDVGEQEVKAIGGYLTSKGQPFSDEEVRRFAVDNFGGVDAIKKGTPVNSAIMNMRKMTNRGKPIVITPSSIKSFLREFPTGNPATSRKRQ